MQADSPPHTSDSRCNAQSVLRWTCSCSSHNLIVHLGIAVRGSGAGSLGCVLSTSIEVIHHLGVELLRGLLGRPCTLGFATPTLLAGSTTGTGGRLRSRSSLRVLAIGLRCSSRLRGVGDALAQRRRLRNGISSDENLELKLVLVCV